MTFVKKLKSRLAGLRLNVFAVILILFVVNFFLPRLMPGDPFLYMEVTDGELAYAFTAEQVEEYRSYFGLNKPLFVQFVDYVKGLFRFDLGYSIYYKEPVSRIILKRLPWTLGVSFAALVLSSFLGSLLGLYAAVQNDKKRTSVLHTVLITLNEIPALAIGLILLFVFSVQFKLFPLSGGRTAFAQYANTLAKIKDYLHHAFLPILSLTISRLGGFYLLARASTLSVLGKDYIRTARAKALGKKRIFIMHIFRNASPPIITRIFMGFARIIGGSVLIESLFAYPGLGSLIREAVFARDYALLQGCFLFISVATVLLNRLADKVYGKLDPRMKEVYHEAT